MWTEMALVMAPRHGRPRRARATHARVRRRAIDAPPTPSRKWACHPSRLAAHTNTSGRRAMKVIQCENCKSVDMVRRDGVWVCQACGPGW